jgi:hypothetical protein
MHLVYLECRLDLTFLLFSLALTGSLLRYIKVARDLLI